MEFCSTTNHSFIKSTVQWNIKMTRDLNNGLNLWDFKFHELNFNFINSQIVSGCRESMNRYQNQINFTQKPLFNYKTFVIVIIDWIWSLVDSKGFTSIETNYGDFIRSWINSTGFLFKFKDYTLRKCKLPDFVHFVHSWQRDDQSKSSSLYEAMTNYYF